MKTAGTTHTWSSGLPSFNNLFSKNTCQCDGCSTYMEPIGNRFAPPTLSGLQVLAAQNELLHRETRRESFRLGNGPLRLLVDGDEQLCFDPSCRLQKKLRVPENALFIGLHGNDAYGDLLLAAFIIPSWMRIQRLIDEVALRHASGHFIRISITSICSQRIESLLLQISCSPARGLL